MDQTALYRHYRTLLLDEIVPFWLRRGVDREFGGVLSVMAEDGTPLGTDKYIWSQGRWAWTCAALYNRIEPRPEFLDLARQTISFLLRHGRDREGAFLYRTSRDGKPLDGPVSIYSDCFAVYALSEYCRATRDLDLLSVATETFHSICRRVESPDFRATEPYPISAPRRIHGIPMMLTEVANELALTTGDPAIEAAALSSARTVMERHVSPERQCLLEFLDWNYQPLPSPEGTYVMPGHAIESMWFVMHLAHRQHDKQTVARAAEVIRWHIEKGWDPEFGGLFLAIDAEGGVPFRPHWEKKLWWPHVEALYALLLVHQLTGERWASEWFDRVYAWSFSHFYMPECGEWRQRLDRQGNPIDTVVALPVKDPFHLPRALILSLQLLQAGAPYTHPL